MLTITKKMILANSSGVGGMPMVSKPIPISMKVSAKNEMLITISAATNFALIR